MLKESSFDASRLDPAERSAPADVGKEISTFETSDGVHFNVTDLLESALAMNFTPSSDSAIDLE